MKKVLLTAAVLGALTSCGQLAGTLVNRLYPDGIDLSSVALSVPTGSTAETQVLYVQPSLFEGVDSVIHSVMKGWPTPQLLGDVAYVRHGGNVTGIELYVRPDLDGCTATTTAGVPAFLCPLAGESDHRLGTVTVSGSLQTWGPLATTTLRQAVQAKTGYLGLRVTSGKAARGDELHVSVKLRPG